MAGGVGIDIGAGFPAAPRARNNPGLGVRSQLALLSCLSTKHRSSNVQQLSKDLDGPEPEIG